MWAKVHRGAVFVVAPNETVFRGPRVATDFSLVLERTTEVVSRRHRGNVVVDDEIELAQRRSKDSIDPVLD